MTQEEKIELRREVCARMLYGLKALATHSNQVVDILRGGCYDGEKYYFIPSILGLAFEIEDFKIYLRPMSSMTEKEKAIYSNYKIVVRGLGIMFEYNLDFVTEWLLKHHFDYRGLIEKGLAVEAPEGMYDN